MHSMRSGWFFASILFAATCSFSSKAVADGPLTLDYSNEATSVVPRDPFVRQVAYGVPDVAYGVPDVAYGVPDVAYGVPDNGPPLPPVVEADDWQAGLYDEESYDFYGIPWYQRGSWVAGADILFMRRHHSDNKAFTRQIRPGVGGGGVTNNIDEAIYFRSSYEASVRPYVAYRFCDCCSEIRFSYWNLSGSSSATGTAEAGVEYYQLEVVQLIPGETITSNTSMDSNIFDIEFSRCIRLGDDSCCGCPRWNLQWSAGARIADIQSGNAVFVSNSVTRADTEAQFTGGGPRIGLQGKRFFGSTGQFSIDAGFDIAMLVGQFDHKLARTSANGNLVENFLASTTRVAPVIDLEVGCSWRPHSNWTISTGYLVQAWWDVTAMEEEFTPGVSFIRDDSNITAWEGLTLRVEAVY